jgi:hypothetical protein
VVRSAETFNISLDYVLVGTVPRRRPPTPLW